MLSFLFGKKTHAKPLRSGRGAERKTRATSVTVVTETPRVVEMRLRGASYQTIAKNTHLSQATISRIINRARVVVEG